MSKASDKDKKSPKKPSDMTTIAVSVEISERIEEYCKKHSMLKKDFLRYAIQYIEDFDVDLTSETQYKEEKREEEQQKNEIQALATMHEKFNFLQELRDNGTYKERVKHLKEDNDRLCDEINQLKEKLKKLENVDILLAKAKTELQHCKGLFSSANSQVLKELGIE